MPTSTPSRIYCATATKTVAHGAPVVEDGVAGIAIKTQTHKADSLLASRATIAIGEKFSIDTQGVKTVDNVAGFAKGDPVYIIAATGVLTESASGNVKFGRVVSLPGERGMPAGKVGVDVTKKDF